MSQYTGPRVLLIDSYDSFTHNLAALCRKSIPHCTVHIIKNDEIDWTVLRPKLPYFSAIVIGPGPGSPLIERDVGIVKHIWHLGEGEVIPIFGVCLGLQSLAVEYGATLKRLAVVKHGQISRIQHEGVEIFKGLGEIDAVRYHSLHVELRPEGEIEVLAWTDDGVDDNRIVMGVKHKTRPFWAVQYHPESIMTTDGGSEVLSNFWRLAKTWMVSRGRMIRPWDLNADKTFGLPWPRLHATMGGSDEGVGKAQTAVLQLPDMTLPNVCEVLGVDSDISPFVLLESAARPGRFSIIGCLHASTSIITYFLGDSFVLVKQGKRASRSELGSHDIWSWLASFMRQRKADGGCSEIPFWGGLVGYLSYELGVNSLGVSLSASQEPARHPHANLVFVDRSIVVDTETGSVYVQSLLPRDSAWIASTVKLLKGNFESRCAAPYSYPIATVSDVVLPDENLHMSRINQAKEYLRSGDSYELCLTAQTKVKVQKSSLSGSSSWELYKSLRANNPAPYAAYLRLRPSTLVCSSPERFLSFSRPPGTVYQLRPIKGTLRKGPCITRAVAERALRGSRKEVAENLMIVDLIRHDLHGVVGDNVEVKQFCTVEEYETVWQLVSVIEGSSSGSSRAFDEGELGWEVLKRSMPPGSMTGAPKKRSVEILQTLEDSERSIYSGVCGYWCVSGAGDWSVVIRSCFKHDDDASSEGASTEEVWTIGAGGAITDLSDPQEEWDEMILKLRSTLRAFNPNLKTL